MTNSDPIQWSDAMLTGVAEIDRQHRILVNTLSDAQIKLSGEVDDPVFEQITRDLLAYAIYHFNTEEKLMQQHAYAVASPEEASAHLTAHRRFSEQVVELRDKARAGKKDAREVLLAFLKEWLTHHIMTTDKRLGQFISAHNGLSASGK